jgi:predicted RecB family nuclease
MKLEYDVDYNASTLCLAKHLAFAIYMYSEDSSRIFQLAKILGYSEYDVDELQQSMRDIYEVVSSVPYESFRSDDN